MAGPQAWSPDGKRLLLCAGTQPKPSACPQIWIASIDGAESHPLVRDCICGAVASWSPDGNRILLYGERDSIWTIGIDGSQKREVAIGKHPTLSPDGKMIAFNRRDGYVWVATIDGSMEHAILVIRSRRKR